MATQLDQWEHVVTSDTNTGMYIGMPESFSIEMAPSAIWAHTHLSTICVFDDDDAYAGIYFTEYSYLDDSGVVRTVDVGHPDYKYKKKTLVSSWTMTSLTYEAGSRNIGVRGLMIMELWQG
jgi:hypothetical protein